MIEQLLKEWSDRGIGVLIVGGQVMLAQGLREQTKDLDACLAAKQCDKMLNWLAEKDSQGVDVQIRAGAAPLHPDWLSRGWTCHLEIGGVDRVDFFGIPLRASNRFITRFSEDPKQTALASLIDLGHLKRTERAKDWADIDLIVGRLRERGETNATLTHLFGNPLVEELLANRDRPEFRDGVQHSQQAQDRPILRAGLFAPIGELRAMARAEQRFWEIVGALRSDELTDKLKSFWRKHKEAIRIQKDFAARHTALVAAARADLPVSPITDPTALINQARQESGVNRWPDLLPDTSVIVTQYFPEYRLDQFSRVRDDSGLSRPLTEYLSPEERTRFERSLEEVLKDHWGPDRFEAYRKRFTPPPWLAKIPQLPEHDRNGRLPDFSI